MLVQVYDEKQALPLGEMEKSWMQFPASVASYAYAWALANVEYIVQTDGMERRGADSGSDRAGSSTEAAMQEVLHLNYDWKRLVCGRRYVVETITWQARMYVRDGCLLEIVVSI